MRILGHAPSVDVVLKGMSVLILLAVLKRPEFPLHNNLSEGHMRDYVKKRKISGSTRSELGRCARDTFASLRKKDMPTVGRELLGIPAGPNAGASVGFPPWQNWFAERERSCGPAWGQPRESRRRDSLRRSEKNNVARRSPPCSAWRETTRAARRH